MGKSLVSCFFSETQCIYIYFFLLLFCVLSLDVKCFCVCAVMPVSANGLGISLGFTRFLNKISRPRLRLAQSGWTNPDHRDPAAFSPRSFTVIRCMCVSSSSSSSSSSSTYLAPDDGWFRVADGYTRHRDWLTRVALVDRQRSQGKIRRICKLFVAKTNTINLVKNDKDHQLCSGNLTGHKRHKMQEHHKLCETKWQRTAVK